MEQSGSVPARNSRVLLVDDSKLIRFAGKRFLDPNYEVILAADGLEAWQRLEHDREIGALVTDLNMPRMDGFELIGRVRGSIDERLRRLPIVVVTDIDEVAGRRRAIDMGADEVVPKPFSGSDLLTPLRHYLSATEPTYRCAGPLPNVERTTDGLINRLEQILSFHSRHGLEFSLLHARLDNHDRILGRHGPNWAESVMRHLERTLAREIRIEDSVGRSAESTFTVILMGTPLPGAKRLCERLRGHFACASVRFPGRSLDLFVSLSLQRVGPGQDQSAAGLLQAGLQRLEMPANVSRLPRPLLRHA